MNSQNNRNTSLCANTQLNVTSSSTFNPAATITPLVLTQQHIDSYTRSSFPFINFCVFLGNYTLTLLVSFCPFNFAILGVVLPVGYLPSLLSLSLILLLSYCPVFLPSQLL